MHNRLVLCLISLSSLAAAASAQNTKPVPPDDRFKTDILVVVAHPDDETEITGYLARAIYDEHKRVAVIFGTRGNGGGDATGLEQAAALGAEREIEARRALAYLGVANVWFLGAPDTPGQDVLRSLETWGHGSCVEQTVRLVRLTRPEVVMTWLPDYVAGENHGDHQAAGVIATEAFDMAGDPSAFPEQVSAPRDRNNIGNLTEGLLPWQAKKLYYFTDATNPQFQAGKGPRYSTEETSHSKKVPYYKIAAEEMSYHLTQGDTGQMAVKAIQTGDYTYFRQPVLLIAGKSLVPGSVTGDSFEGIKPGAIAFATPPSYNAPHRSGLSIELGGPWIFYHSFWQTHGLTSVPTLLSENGIDVVPGERVHVPVLLHNDTETGTAFHVTAEAPAEWTELSGAGTYEVPAHQTVPLYITARTPAGKGKDPQRLLIHAEAPESSPEPIKVVVYPDPSALPQ